MTDLVGLTVYTINAQKEKSSWFSEQDIKAKATEYINSELIQQGNATVNIIDKENKIYKLEVSYNGQKILSYISKDGKRFFPRVIDITGGKTAKNDTQNIKASSKPVADVAEEKSDKPKVELFVMSHCSYGTQIEKGIVPVAKLLRDK